MVYAQDLGKILDKEQPSLHRNGKGLDMLHRLKIMNIAEIGFKENIRKVENLNQKDRAYILDFGELGEKLFYEQIRILEAKEKNPVLYRKGPPLE